jgi:hypothetical protein
MTPATTTCDACGKRYAFTSHKDRCPICCPVTEDDELDNYDQIERENDQPGFDR